MLSHVGDCKAIFDDNDYPHFRQIQLEYVISTVESRYVKIGLLEISVKSNFVLDSRFKRIVIFNLFYSFFSPKWSI